jgi:hypothetical protein
MRVTVGWLTAISLFFFLIHVRKAGMHTHTAPARNIYKAEMQ